ncbi:hypothetical protein SR870_16950 [Rhodopseudomonas palustris]|uniref:hypothetical protein n=1 Tax=Rhodopseudomonas palustris TaxID=1076 RepID=UPI002ACD6DD6|nr:hypothetical protein [Rhodopseudomonas palustris]WQG98379.1 hypothetical protein SR870_16950 [Rhodopseudomonas palustris]
MHIHLCNERPYCVIEFLKNLATVRNGVAFREAVRHVEGAPIAVVQAGDIGLEGNIRLEELLRISSVPTQGDARSLTPGEVLLQSRGQSYRAGVVPPHAGSMVAAASVLIMTPGPALLPAYLAQFLNSPSTQMELRARATGATIANLKKSELEQLLVPVPSLGDQEKLVALGAALRVQLRIEARLAELRRLQLRALMKERAERNRGR